MESIKEGTEGSRSHTSIARVRDAWYIACRSADLKRRPIQREIYGSPIVLFRSSDGRPAALLDRCAHRNVPLSLGTCESGEIVCGYHGWTFNQTGACVRVPALEGPPAGKARRVPAYPVKEQQGFVWVFATTEVEPATEPFSFPHVDDADYTTAYYGTTSSGTLHANLENILDVPHTAFLHRGLFRGLKRNAVTAKVRRYTDRVEAEFTGEPVPKGLVGRILAPRGGTIEHTDRFFLPSIAQVEYRLGRNHVILTSALTPTSDFEVRLHSVATFRTSVPGFLLKPLLFPIGQRILAQDRAMLGAQLDTIRRFGGEQFVSTEVDLLGPHIWRLLKAAERGVSAPSGAEPVESLVNFLA